MVDSWPGVVRDAQIVVGPLVGLFCQDLADLWLCRWIGLDRAADGNSGGGGASLAAVAEASFSQETDVMAPTPLPYPEILQLQTLVSEQQAKIIELEGEVREGDGYAHRLVNTQDEAGPRQGAHEAAFWRATGTGCASATGGCGLLGARQGAPQGDSQGS